jgi:SAM-dependent methyltransferase
MLVETDISAAMLRRPAGSGRARAVADEEALPFAAGCFDLVVSALSLHWVNDLPGALVQIRRCLKPDGLFLAAMFGTGTLAELRQALVQAELEMEAGAGPRVSPFVEVAEAGALLHRAGFALPVADADTVETTYADAPALMLEVRGMGEANAMLGRRKAFTRGRTLARAAALYADGFAAPQGRVRASFEILTLTGWAPHPAQPQPLAPGSAQARLADALGTTEHPAGDKARPRRD